MWVPSIAVDRRNVLYRRSFPGWKRSFFVGGLREGETPRTGQLQRIEFNEKWEEIRREPMLRELHQRIRDVRAGAGWSPLPRHRRRSRRPLSIEPAPRP